MKGAPLLWFVLSGFALAVLLWPTLFDTRPRLIYNPSNSAEIGWYYVAPMTDLDRGDLVAAWLPDDARAFADARGYLPRTVPVIKTIAALGGDTYCMSGDTIRLQVGLELRVLNTDRHGRSMPRLPQGCYRLEDQQVFLVSTRTDTSFDSRYFGPVEITYLIGPVRYIARPVDVQVGPRYGDRAWARALGAECKIKAGSAARVLQPCLHITFYSAIATVAALHFSKYPIGINGLRWCYFTPLHRATRRILHE